MAFTSLSSLLFAILCVSLSAADDLQVGTTVGSQLGYTENVKLSSIPFTSRTKNVFFSSTTNQIIKGISAIDMDRSKGKVQVTSGGVGSTFTNIRLKSERGEGLNYQIQIFV